MKLPNLISLFRSKRSEKNAGLPSEETWIDERVHQLLVRRALRNKMRKMKLTDPEMVDMVEQIVYEKQQALEYRIKKENRKKLAQEILLQISRKKIV